MIGRQPDAVIACVGGGSNAMGIFHPYIDHAATRLIGVEAAGEGIATRQARGLARGRPPRRAARQSHLPAAGRRRPDHRDAFDLGRPRLSRRRPRARVAEGQRPRRVRRRHRRRGARGVPRLCRTEGIIPALESSHAVAYAMKLAPTLRARPASARQSLRPRRQGHAPSPSVGSTSTRSTASGSAHGRMSRIDATRSRALARATRPHGADPVHHRRRSARRRDGRDHARAGRRRRRHHRARRAVLRSDGRRPGDPARERARARARRRPGATCSAMVREFRDARRDDAGRADGLRQSDRAHRRRALRRTRRRRPASTACSSSTIRPRKCDEFAALLEARGIDPIFLLAPTTTRRAHRRVAEAARGYVYYVSLKGVTGAGHFDIADVAAHDRRESRRTSKLPVGVGFGIRDAADGARRSPTSPTRS